MFNSNSAWNWWNIVRNMIKCMNVTIHFFTYRSYYGHLFCKSTAIVCQLTRSALFKNEVLWHSSNGLLQSYVIMPGDRLPETENKRICQISGPKSGRGRLRNLRSGRLRESFWNSVWLRNKTVVCKVVAYGRWSLWLVRELIVAFEVRERNP